MRRNWRGGRPGPTGEAVEWRNDRLKPVLTERASPPSLACRPLGRQADFAGGCGGRIPRFQNLRPLDAIATKPALIAMNRLFDERESRGMTVWRRYLSSRAWSESRTSRSRASVSGVRK